MAGGTGTCETSMEKFRGPVALACISAMECNDFEAPAKRMLLRKTVRFERGVENTDVRPLRLHGEQIGG
jgi:hypothetical protein